VKRSGTRCYAPRFAPPSEPVLPKVNARLYEAVREVELALRRRLVPVCLAVIHGRGRRQGPGKRRRALLRGRRRRPTPRATPRRPPRSPRVGRSVRGLLAPLPDHPLRPAGVRQFVRSRPTIPRGVGPTSPASPPGHQRSLLFGHFQRRQGSTRVRTRTSGDSRRSGTHWPESWELPHLGGKAAEGLRNPHCRPRAGRRGGGRSVDGRPLLPTGQR
jgi:hypothetical protein